MTGWLRPLKTGIEITVRLTPRSSSDKVEGLAAGADGTPHLVARVRAVPEKGKANAALEELISRWAATPKRSVSVIGGSTARLKTVLISGDPAALEIRLAELAGEARAGQP